jgi:twitching motility protein PilT
MDTHSTQELDDLLKAMIHSAEGISDLLFVASRPPQMEIHGKIKPLGGDTPAPALTSERIEGLARAIIKGNPRLLEDLAKSGSCDCSYSLPELCRFRVNIYKQNGNFAMVLRRLQSKVPSLDALNLPPVFREVIKEKNGLIFVTGGTGSGKTTTLAALLNEVNQTEEVHVVTLEDPIEFLHPHKSATFSQRELGRDFFNFPDGLRAALRQAPKIIFVGEIRDRDTMEIALTAGETGHVVFSTLHTISAAQTVNRILGMFTKDEEQQVRERLVGSLRYIISQRLVPKKGGGRLLATELMGSNMRVREAIALGENENRRLTDIIEAGSTAGWHSFEQSLLRAYEQDLVTEETALLNCINKSAMHQRLDYINKTKQAASSSEGLKLKMDKTLPVAPAMPKPPTMPPTLPPQPPRPAA